MSKVLVDNVRRFCMRVRELGEQINNAGREFKIWFTDFTLVYSPIFIVFGLILTGVDLFLNLGLGNSMWFRIPWSIVQLFAVDGLWFATWNRILTDEYRMKYIPYHAFLIFFGIILTAIAITMNYIVFTQDYIGLKDSVAAMNFLGIPVGLFLFVRSVLLMLTATLAIVLDKVMRTKRQYKASTAKSKPKYDPIPQDHVESIEETKPELLALPEPKPSGYKEQIRETIEKFMAENKPYTYQDIADAIPCSVQTVKVHAPKIKKELAL
jgi:hypothetical protein